MVFSTELQETLAGLEEDLDIPSFARDRARAPYAYIHPWAAGS
jgi:hypothetical protein